MTAQRNHLPPGKTTGSYLLLSPEKHPGYFLIKISIGESFGGMTIEELERAGRLKSFETNIERELWQKQDEDFLHDFRTEMADAEYCF